MRWVFRLLGIVVLLLIFAVGAAFFLPKDRIAKIASDQLRAQTGRELTVSGELALSFWPVLAVKTGPVTLSNAEWAGDQPMVSASALSIGVDASTLFGGDIRIKHIEAESPVVRLATRADGRGNWEFDTAAADAGADTAVPDAADTRGLSLERLRISDASLVYAAAGEAPVTIEGVDATLVWPDPGAPATVEVSLPRGADTLSLNAEIADVQTFLGGEASPLSARGGTSGGTFSFTGRASMAGDAAGQFALNTSDTGAFLAGLGAPGAAPPAGFGRAIDMSADLTFTEGRNLALRDLALKLDSNRFAGSVDLTLDSVPTIRANLAAGALDFASLDVGGAPGGTAASGTTTEGWSTTPIDASGLGLVNGEISLSADSVDLGAVKLGATRTKVTIDRSRAVLDLRQVSVFDGTISGQLVANNRSGLSVGGNLQASEIETQRMLSELADITRFSGKANGQLEFLGSGQSVDQIMRSLSGKGGMAVGRGVIAGIDLDRLMRSGDATGGTTVFDSLTADFTLQNGNMLNDNLLLLLANFRAEGEGRIGLGARDIDYLFTPIALRANSGQGLAIPVRIKGPWSGPKIIPDLEQALRLDVDGKVEEVKQEAREKVEERLRDELGVTPQEGQSTEDAIKDTLEERAKDSLRRLLQGD